MKRFWADVTDGLEAIFGPILMPARLHRVVWTTIWSFWIIGAVAFVYGRLAE